MEREDRATTANTIRPCSQQPHPNFGEHASVAALNAKSLSIVESPVSADQLGLLLDLMVDGAINGRIARDVFEDMVETSEDPADIVEKKGLKQVTDSDAIESAVDAVIANAPEQVVQFRGGNEKIAGWFVGQVMKATRGRANPGMVNRMLKEKLSGFAL